MTEEEKKLMGSRIRERRKSKDWSQDQLADMLGMKRPNVAAYEAGRVVPPASVMKQLAELFGTSSDYLLGATDDMTPPDNRGDATATRVLSRLRNLKPERQKVVLDLLDAMDEIEEEERNKK